jgi:ABC-type sugar transport system permease subunit
MQLRHSVSEPTKERKELTGAMSLLARIWRARLIYGFIAPFFVLFAIFQLLPLIWSLWLSFHEWNGLGPVNPVGLYNYRFLLRDEMFMDALYNTSVYWIAKTLLIIPLSLLLASLLNHVWLKGKSAYRTLMFLPYVTATVAVGLIFTMIFDFNSGLVNNLLRDWGMRPQPWLTSVEMSKIPVIILSVWRTTPFFTLIVLSGMQGISPDLYEAAKVDGASGLQRFFSITIPSLAPILFFCFITISIDSFRIFTEPYILTQGGPGTSSLSIVQYLYVNGFRIFKLGMAATVGWALTFILLIVSAAHFYILRRQSGLMESN